MKRLVIFLVLALLAATGAGQSSSGDLFKEEKIQSPKFLAGDIMMFGEKVECFNDYLNKMVIYPKKSIECYQQGTEIIEFVISSTGEPKEIKVLNSVCPEIDEEVIRVVKSTRGKWIPGTINGNPADMKQEAAVVFQLCSCEKYIKKAKKYAQKGTQLMFVHNNPEKAMKYLNRAVIYLPKEENFLATRGLCRYKLGDTKGALTDWERIQVLAERNNSQFLSDEIVTHTNLPEKLREIIYANNN